MKAIDLYKRKCKQCGKAFESGTEWSYKEKRYTDCYDYFCSWRCLREWQKTHVKQRKNRAGA